MSRGIRQLVCAALCVVAPSLVRADESWSLTVIAPPESDCVDTVTLGQRVRERVGGSGWVAVQDASAHVQVTLARRDDASGYVATVATVDGARNITGQRVLHGQGDACAELDAALVLVVGALVGVALEPGATLDATEPAQPHAIEDGRDDTEESPDDAAGDDSRGSPDAQGDANRGAPDDAIDDAVAEPERSEPAAPWHVSIGVGGMVASGLLPNFTPGARASLVAAWRDLRLIVDGRWLPHQTTDLPDVGRGVFSALGGSLHVCGVTSETGVFTTALCADMTAGALWSRTEGLWRNARTVQPLLTVGPSLRVTLAVLESLDIELMLGLAVPVLRRRFYYLGPSARERTYHETAVGAWLGLGGVWRISS